MERALLQGEKEAERALLQKEQKAADQLQEKLVTLETGIQKERDKVTNNWPGSVLGPVTSERRRNALYGAPYPLPHHPPFRLGGLCAPPGAGALSSVEGTNLESSTGWADVWGLLCLGLCYLWVPGCLPFWALHGCSRKYQSPSWAVSTARGTGVGE